MSHVSAEVCWRWGRAHVSAEGPSERSLLVLNTNICSLGRVLARKKADSLENLKHCAKLSSKNTGQGPAGDVSFSKHFPGAVGFTMVQPEACPREKLGDCSSSLLHKQVPCQEQLDLEIGFHQTNQVPFAI